MLITQLKAKEAITSLTAGKKVFIINCHGCKEVHFPEKEAVELQKELSAEGNVTGIMTTDYICNPENMELRLQKHMSKIQEADLVLVFSCGVGVQTISEYLEDKMVCAACDTYPVPGFQGVTPLEFKCDQCGLLSESDRWNLPDHSMFQEPCEWSVRRFQEWKMRSGQRNGVWMGAYLQTPERDWTP